MEKYTTKQLAELAGTSVRTLHYYEEVDLLHPKRMPNGYRSYGPADVERLRQILAMRACRMPLAEIRQLLDGSDTDAVGLLARHLEELRAQERQVKEAIARTRAAMELLEGVSRMGTREGFEELKQRRLEEFESSYGDEARRRYGADVIDQTNERLMGLSQEEWNEKDRIEKRIIELLAEAKADGAREAPRLRSSACSTSAGSRSTGERRATAQRRTADWPGSTSPTRASSTTTTVQRGRGRRSSSSRRSRPTCRRHARRSETMPRSACAEGGMRSNPPRGRTRREERICRRGSLFFTGPSDRRFARGCPVENTRRACGAKSVPYWATLGRNPSDGAGKERPPVGAAATELRPRRAKKQPTNLRYLAGRTSCP